MGERDEEEFTTEGTENTEKEAEEWKSIDDWAARIPQAKAACGRAIYPSETGRAKK